MIDNTLHVVIVKDDIIVGHLHKALSLFLETVATIGCAVVGTRTHLADVLQSDSNSNVKVS